MSVQNTKNSTENSYIIQKILSEAGLNKGVTLSIQSMDKDVLKNIKRENIKLEVYGELQRRFANDKIETYTDFILALPGETYATFKKGVSELIKNGQHNRIQFNNLSILPNAEMNDPAYKANHGIIIRETKAVNMHTSIIETEEVYETQQLVVATKTMPKEEWVKTRAFGWATALLHFDKIFQIPLIIFHNACSVEYSEMIDAFLEADKNEYPIISEINEFFIAKAKNIQNGGEEYCASEKWLKLWWPPDELTVINLCAEEKIDSFYCEMNKLFKQFLKKNNLTLPEKLVDEAIEVNRNLIKLPFQTSDVTLHLTYNIFDVYVSVLKGLQVPIEDGSFSYRIDRTNKAWLSWEEWCKEVIWYGNKKGAYLYKCTPILQKETVEAV